MVIGQDMNKTSGVSINPFEGMNMEANYNTNSNISKINKDLKDTTFNSNVSKGSRNLGAKELIPGSNVGGDSVYKTSGVSSQTGNDWSNKES